MRKTLKDSAGGWEAPGGQPSASTCRHAGDGPWRIGNDPPRYYQTDHLKFSQQFIGNLTALGSLAAVGGALVYAPLSRKYPLKALIVVPIGIAVTGTLAYLPYRNLTSAIVIDTVFGGIGMVTQLAFLDLAAKSCPRRVEGTFFALLMSIYNAGTRARRSPAATSTTGSAVRIGIGDREH